jgi:hypothetical protein
MNNYLLGVESPPPDPGNSDNDGSDIDFSKRKIFVDD